MLSSQTKLTRVKIGATLDPHLVAEVDRYVATHEGADRSAVIDDALRLWYEREQDRAMERQFREDAAYRDSPERQAWRRIRTAAARRTFGKRT